MKRMYALFPYRQATDAIDEPRADCLSKKNLRLLPRLLLFLAVAPFSPANSETAGKQTSTVDTGTQAIKDEAIELIGRLRQLEQKLLYPAHTRLSVFVSVAENSPVQPRSISILIDGDTVTNHVYTQRETDALRSGGIQHLFTGNTTTGKHSLSVRFDETRKDGRVDTHKAEYNFKKDTRARYIEISVGGDRSGKPVTIRSRH